MIPMTQTAVTKSIEVKAAPDRAFRVFTEEMATWWPLATHHLAQAGAVDAVMEPSEGGRWYERDARGEECDWGRVLVWDPPSRVVLVWQLSADWSYDPSLHTEIEVRFTAEDDGRTRVDLEHRKLEAYAEAAEQMRAVLGSDDGWGGPLRRFAAAAQGA